MASKRSYQNKERFKRLKIPGLPHVTWGWFRDTITTRDICFFLGVKTKEDVRHIWETLFKALPPEEDTLEGFEGLHIKIQKTANPSSYQGSAIFLKTKAPSILAHEVYHAVCACSEFTAITQEEFRAQALSSWMDIISEVLNQKTQKQK